MTFSLNSVLSDKRSILAFSLGALPLLYWACHYLNVDLWYDEAYSLENYVLSDFRNTAFNYSAPNNHIFFNLSNQLITRASGLRTSADIADHVYVLRAFQVCISLLTGLYACLFARNILKLEQSKHVAAVILFTTIPFMNFSLQLRGYNLSSLFQIMLMYHVWNFILHRSRKDPYLIVISTALLLYTIPSNLYALAAIMGGVGMLFLYTFFIDRAKSTPYFKVILLMILGLSLAFVLYTPVLEDVVSNRFVTETPENRFYALGLVPHIMASFLSGRLLLLIPVMSGLWLAFKHRDVKTLTNLAVLLFALTVPFILAFIHQKLPFQRVFVPLAPLFSLLVSGTVCICIHQVQNPKAKTAFLAAIYIYCFGTFIHEMDKNNTDVKTEFVDQGTILQDMYQNYYLSDFFDQKQSMQILKEATAGGSMPVFVLNQIDRPSTNLYLSAFGLRYKNVKSTRKIVSSLNSHGHAVVLTSNKNKTLQELQSIEGVTASVLTPEYIFSNVIVLEKQ